MYSRFWNMFLYDLGCVCEPEPFRKLVNQGMIQGRSNFVYRVVGTNKFVSFGLKESYETQEIHVDVNIVRNDQLDLDAFRAWRPEFADAEFILEDGKYVCGWAIEKMSKSMFNVVNPDYIVDQYGADTLRMYEMFLGPLEQSKPWDTNGIDGVHKFLRRFWRLFHAGDALAVTDEAPTPKELKTLHKTIKKVREGHRELLVQHVGGSLHDLPQRTGRMPQARDSRTARRPARTPSRRISPKSSGNGWDIPRRSATPIPSATKAIWSSSRSNIRS